MRAARPARLRRKTLRVQAGVPHTFGPLLIPLALLLIGFGGFELHRAIAQPLESDAASILFNSVLLASGLLLAVCLARSARPASDASQRPDQISKPKMTKFKQPRQTQARADQQPSLPFHRIYVDDARISR